MRTTFLLLLLSLSSIVVAQEKNSNPPESTPAESAPKTELDEVTAGDGGTVLPGEKPSEQSLLRLQVVFVPDGIEQQIQNIKEMSDQDRAAVLAFLKSTFRSKGSVSDKGTQQSHVALDRTFASAVCDRLIALRLIRHCDKVLFSATESFAEVKLHDVLFEADADKTLWQATELEERGGTRGFQLRRQMESNPGDTNEEPTSVAVVVRITASETAVLPWYFHFLEEDIRRESRERWHGEHFVLIDTANAELTPVESAPKKKSTEVTVPDSGTVRSGGIPNEQPVERHGSTIAKALESATHIVSNVGARRVREVPIPDLNADSRQRLGDIISRLMKHGTIGLGATSVTDSDHQKKRLSLNFTEEDFENGGKLLFDVIDQLHQQQIQHENNGRQPQIQALLGTNESGQKTKLVELPVRHAKPADVAKVLNEQFPSTTFSASTDCIYGRVSEADLTAVDRFVRSLETKAMDSAQQEAERQYKWDFAPGSTADASLAIEVRLKHIRASDAIDALRQLGLITDKLLAVANPNGNAILFRVTRTEKGQPYPFEAATQLIEKIDVPITTNDETPTIEGAPRGDKLASNLQSAYDRAELQSAQIATELRKLRATGRNTLLIPMHIQKLRESVQIAFDIRMQLQQAQLAEAESDLILARERLARRQQIADKIIDRRTQELQSGEDTSWQGYGRVSQSSSAESTDVNSPYVGELRGSSEALESPDTVEAKRPGSAAKTSRVQENTGRAPLRSGSDFENTPWMEVLSSLAADLSLSLDVQKTPKGGVSLLRSYLTAKQTIAELNRMLASQALTIQQTPTHLILKPLTPKPMADPNANSAKPFFEMGEGTVRGTGKVVAFGPDTSQRAVELWISGNDIPIVQQGDHVRLHFEGWPAVRSDGAFGGEVMTIDSTADTAGNFRILIKADGKDPWPDERYLRPGVRANCWVFTGSRSDTKSGGN